jgi:hypothetical protein
MVGFLVGPVMIWGVMVKVGVKVIVGVKVAVTVKVRVGEGMLVCDGVGVVVGPHPRTLQELKIIGRISNITHNACFFSGFFRVMRNSASNKVKRIKDLEFPVYWVVVVQL